MLEPIARERPNANSETESGAGPTDVRRCLGVDAEPVRRLSRVSPVRGGARRVQRKVHVQSDGSAGGFLRDEPQPHPCFVSQLFPADRSLAVLGPPAREVDMTQSQTVARKIRAIPVHDFLTDVLAGLGGLPNRCPASTSTTPRAPSCSIASASSTRTTRRAPSSASSTSTRARWLRSSDRARGSSSSGAAAAPRRACCSTSCPISTLTCPSISPPSTSRAPGASSPGTTPSSRGPGVSPTIPSRSRCPSARTRGPHSRVFPRLDHRQPRPEQARDFLHVVAGLCQGGGGLLIGVDLKKDPAHARSGLQRRQRRDRSVQPQPLDSHQSRARRRLRSRRLPPPRFLRRQADGRIEMQLVSLRRQTVRWERRSFASTKAKQSPPSIRTSTRWVDSPSWQNRRGSLAPRLDRRTPALQRAVLRPGATQESLNANTAAADFRYGSSA